MHETYHYSVMLEADQTGINKVIDLPVGDYTLVSDVPEGNSPWVYIKSTTHAPVGDRSHCIWIHIHNAQNIEGAGWNHGKFGSGNTIPIQ
jgi:hypothetical protein